MDGSLCAVGSGLSRARSLLVYSRCISRAMQASSRNWLRRRGTGRRRGRFASVVSSAIRPFQSTHRLRRSPSGCAAAV